MLASDQVTDPLHAYQLAKRGNSLRVMAEAVRWGKRGARVNTISPGIIFTPLAKDELTGPRGEGYRRMIELSPVGRGGTPDEVGAVGALLMGPDGTFITGSDFLMDGGVTASYFHGELAPRRSTPNAAADNRRRNAPGLHRPGRPGPRRRNPDPASTEEFTNHAAVRWVPNSAAGTACMRDLRCVLAAARHARMLPNAVRVYRDDVVEPAEFYGDTGHPWEHVPVEPQHRLD